MKRDPAASVAVIGAGISALVCARSLVNQGLVPAIFEKSRGVGGRMSTRRADRLRFDHGAQYFTAFDTRFKEAVANWIVEGVAERWRGRIRILRNGTLADCDDEPKRFVGVPGMNSLCRALAGGLEINLKSEVTALVRDNGKWNLRLNHGAEVGPFSAVVCSAPPPQSAALFAEHSPLAERIREVQMQPCWATMVNFSQRIPLNCEAAFVHDSSLSWIAKNSSKPGRSPNSETWVLHATGEWSLHHLEDAPEDASSAMLQAFSESSHCSVAVEHAVAHRWRYALPTNPLSEASLFDQEARLGVCGDWCGGPRVEGAFLSGLALADQIASQTPTGRSIG